MSIFIGIEKNALFEVVSGAAIGLKLGDVGPDKCQQVKGHDGLAGKKCRAGKKERYTLKSLPQSAAEASIAYFSKPG